MAVYIDDKSIRSAALLTGEDLSQTPLPCSTPEEDCVRNFASTSKLLLKYCC